MLPQIDSLLLERVSNVRQHRLARLLSKFVRRIERQYENIRVNFVFGDLRGSTGGCEQRLIINDRLAELELCAPRHQLSLPLHRRRARAGRLRHDANRDINQHLAVRLVFGAQSQQLAVQFGAHLAGQQIGPAHIRHLAQELESLLDEKVGILGTAEQQPNHSAALSIKTAPRQQAQVLERVWVVFAGGQYLSTEHRDARVQARPPMAALPVIAAAVS